MYVELPNVLPRFFVFIFQSSYRYTMRNGWKYLTGDW